MNQKIVALKQLSRSLKKARQKKKKIVFTNGTFDILHFGHVDYLKKAKKAGDLLIVAVNSDRSVRSYKSPNRPVNALKYRMAVLSALACVDYVIPFSEPTPLKLVEHLKPDVLVKGADWKKDQIAGAREVESWGGRVKRIRLVNGFSTTGILRKLGVEKG